MSVIVPAIIPSSLEDLEHKLALLHGLADDVQIDIVDGVYASPASWPFSSDPGALARMLREGVMLPGAGEFGLEIDLMAGSPERVAGLLIELGASRITVHAASTPHLGPLLREFRDSYGHGAAGVLSVGIALADGADPEPLAQYFDQIDYVQFMGIRTIGHQGERFDPAVVRAITLFRKRYPHMPVQVDGGVSLSTAPMLLEAGVSRLVVGSALWNAPDLMLELERFKGLLLSHGAYE